jgi:hypothetical protein
VPEFWTTISETLTVIDGVFDVTAAGGIVFHAAGLDAPAVAAVQARVRRRLLRIFVRRGLLPDDDARAMRPLRLAALGIILVRHTDHD